MAAAALDRPGIRSGLPGSSSGGSGPAPTSFPTGAISQTIVSGSSSGMAPVPMNIIATWELDRSSPSCVPRLCSLTFKKLVVMKEIDKELNSLSIAVKVQGYKRLLRSHEYVLPLSGPMETDLELHLSLQYPHFLKRANLLQIMLQRRKRYKHHTILGYKTLAEGVIDMTDVMQHPTDKEHILYLYSKVKEPQVRVAEITVCSLSSQPIDHEDSSGRARRKTKTPDRSPYMTCSEEDDDSYLSEQEASDLYDDLVRKLKKKVRRKMNRNSHLTRHPNFKQKFVALLKKFKVTDGVLDMDPVNQTQEVDEDLDLLYHSLEAYNQSDSGSEMEDNESIISMPKPQLKPFFEGMSHSSSNTEIRRIYSEKIKERQLSFPGSEFLSVGKFNIHEDYQCDRVEHTAAVETEMDDIGTETKEVRGSWDVITELTDSPVATLKTESQISLLPSKVENKFQRWPNSSSNSCMDIGCFSDSRAMVPRMSVYNHLNQILISDECLPDNIILINTMEWQGRYVAEVLHEQEQPIVCTCSAADVQAAFNTIFTRIQRFCNCHVEAVPTLKVAVAGDQSYLSTILRFFVEQLANKTADWLNYIVFLIIPIGSNPLAKYIASFDSRFNSIFMDTAWRELFRRTERPTSVSIDVAGRVVEYLAGANVSHQFPISEAMLTYKQKNIDSSQEFVPFVDVVKVGIVEHSLLTSVDSDDAMENGNTGILSSQTPPLASLYGKELGSPLSQSPSVSTGLPGTACPCTSGELMGLQVDYWTWQGLEKKKDGEKRDVRKNTLKGNFFSLQVSRQPYGGTICSEPPPPPNMAMTVVTKNKKVIFLSKKLKEKEMDTKIQAIDGISRLVCTAKHTMLKVIIDGVEWNNVKFFQIAAQWPTHVKHFPVRVFGYTKPM